MNTLLRYTKPISADKTFAFTAGTRYAAVTFDDGFENIIKNALPILQKKCICATVFVVSDYLGKLAGWRRFDPETNGSEKLMSVEQLLTLPPDLISVGSHTMTHPVLTSLSECEAKEEILESRRRLQNILHKDIKLFSFPYGEFNQDLIAWCREAGYTRVFSILPTPVWSNAEEYVTGRVSVEPTDWKLEFSLKLMGAYRWLPLAFAMKKRIFACRGGLK